jgi:histidine ammonia-lyase
MTAEHSATGTLPGASLDTVLLGTGPLTPSEVVSIARHGAPVSLTPEALEAMAASRRVVEQLADDTTPHYGVSTGFGALATKHIPPAQRTQLQRSLIRSHAASSGPRWTGRWSAGLMLGRLSTMATGRTGVRPVVAQTYAGCSMQGSPR